MSTTVTYKGSTLTTAENQTRTLKTAGKYMEDDITIVDVTSGGGGATLQTKTKTYTPTESQQTESITADSGYDGLDEVDVTVNAISSSYVGSAIDRRDSTNLSASGATVTAPAGYYASSASKSVASGTEGTPTASKGSVSNHSVSVTPSVTNTTGWITGSTKTGTAVSVSASELVSGSQTITDNANNIDVTNLASVNVAIPFSTIRTGSTDPSPSLGVDGDVYLKTGGGGGGVTVEALSVTQNGTYTAPTGTAYSPVTVSVAGNEPRKQINFIDYDGTIVDSYTSAEWQSVSSLPSNPSHTGLVAQGWNWTKAQIDAQLTAMPDGVVNVGQMYITASGDTEIDVSFPTADRLSPYLTLGVNGTVRIDWGDNTATETLTGTSLTTRKYIQHTYASPGDYTISVHVMSGSFQPYCGSSSNSLLNSSYASASQNTVYATRVRSVRFGSGVTSIGEYAFNLSYALSYVTLPNSITSIDNDAFYYCRSLTSITIPSGITSIGDYTFGGCGALISASCPSSVTSIGEYAFYNCVALTSATIPNSATSIGEYAFNGCAALTSIAIPGNVTSIDASAFRECRVLASATIQSGITTIGTNAFNTCGMLVSLSLPNGVTSIGNQAFNACYSLMSITIPSSVTSIGNSAFNGCAGAKEIHVKPTTPPTLGSTPFDGYVADCTIYVPSASLADYQATTG